MNAFRTRLFPAHLATLALAACDAAGTALITQSGFGAALLHWMYLLPWTVVFAVPIAAGAAAVCAAARNLDWRAALLVGAPAALAHYAVLVAVGSTFRNRELSALLATTVALGIVGGALVLFGQLRRVTASRPRPATVAALVVAAGVAAFLAYANREGFGQLNRWTLVAPLAAALVYGVGELIGRRLSRVASAWTWVTLASLVGGIGVAAAIGAARPSVVGDASREGPWSQYLARGVQAATDFDGDGSSSLFGGADCAPFDGEVGPGQLEIPGDGIDNNCIGGDASAATTRRAPVWFDLPDELGEYNFLLISAEALRADHMSFAGYERDTTPNLAKLAEDSVIFERFYSASTFTRLSLPSLLTSRTPSAIDFQRQPGKKMPRIAESNPWLPEVLNEAGFRTGAVMAKFSAFDETDSIGLDRGFDLYDTSAKIRYRGGTMHGFAAKKQAKTLLEFIEEAKTQRFFAWVHFLEPHYKYEPYPGSPNFGDDDIANYDREIWGVDHEVGKILDRLRKLGLLDKTIVFVTGDHGEEFMEHGKRFHGSSLYEQQVHTVGLLWVPGVEPQRIEQPATFIDVAPTVTNLLRVRQDFERWGGRNLTGLLFGESVEDRPLILETWSVTTLRNYMAAVIAWPYKLMWRDDSKQAELYDLSKDPGERNDLQSKAAHQRTLESLKTTLFEHVDNHERVYKPAEAAE